MRKCIMVLVGALVTVVSVSCGTSASKPESLTNPAQPGPPPSPTQLAISWNDGNPLVPVCPATQPSDCKSGYTVIDQTTGAVVITLPITTMSYLAADASHQYAVATTGYDWQGNSISSVAISVPQAQ